MLFLKINNFKLNKAPALAKVLTLADLRGLTDTLKGEGQYRLKFRMTFTSFDSTSDQTSGNNMLNYKNLGTFGGGDNSSVRMSTEWTEYALGDSSPSSTEKYVGFGWDKDTNDYVTVKEFHHADRAKVPKGAPDTPSDAILEVGEGE